MIKYSILVNTCDKFEDCWNPFFKLMSLYWPNCKGKIYLNTEFKDYSYSGFDVIPVKGCVGKKYKGRFATWNQCLKWALEKIDTDIFLYMQEDYFLNGLVNNELVEEYVLYMQKHPNVSCIHLTPYGIPSTESVGEMNLCHGNKNFFSYVSCQAAIWRKDSLLLLIRDYETAWNFEWWGSKRAKYMGFDFLTVDNKWAKENPIIPYLCTGVVGGRWFLPVIDLFKKHGIVVDYKRRGFYDPSIKPTLKKRIQVKWSIYKRWKSILEIIKLKYKL